MTARNKQGGGASAGNSFFGDGILFRLAAKMQASLVPELAELGAWAASADTAAKAQAVRLFPPRLFPQHLLGACGGAGQNAGLDFALHPAYHGLLTRARHAGLAASLYEESGNAAGFAARHRARACRLFLMAQADCAPLQEMAQTNAAYAVLAAADADLAAMLRPWIISRIHDPSRRFFKEKQSIALSFAIEEDAAAPCRAEALPDSALPQAPAGFWAETSGALYALHGVKNTVLAPLSDGFIVSAALAGEAHLFFVPLFAAAGQSNSVKLQPAFAPFAAPSAMPVFTALYCNLRFNGSLALRLSRTAAAGAAALDKGREALLADYAALGAGLLRGAVSDCLAAMQRAEQGQKAEQGTDSGLRKRVLADAALDAAAAQMLALRLAQARDYAADNAQEAALAAVLAPALSFWLYQLLPQLNAVLARLSGQALLGQPLAVFGGGNQLLFPDFYAYRGLAAAGNALSLPGQVCAALRAEGAAFSALAAAELDSLPKHMAAGAKQVLNLAAGKAATDENAAFLCADRLIYSLAAAAFYAAECGPVAAAYAESRLGGTRQTGYGDFGLRHNADFILEALYPNL